MKNILKAWGKITDPDKRDDFNPSRNGEAVGSLDVVICAIFSMHGVPLETDSKKKTEVQYKKKMRRDSNTSEDYGHCPTGSCARNWRAKACNLNV